MGGNCPGGIVIEPLKRVLPLLISSQQTEYGANRYISGCGRLISDLLDVTEKFKTNGYLVKIILKKPLIP